MRAMKATPVEDAFARGAKLRLDGRLMRDQLLVRVRKPADVTGAWNLLTVEKVIPAAEIIRPLDQGGCKLLNG
jgi:branched-chain amino acid transport system substrate-binding protein